MRLTLGALKRGRFWMTPRGFQVVDILQAIGVEYLHPRRTMECDTLERSISKPD
jgi:hypothetical protein